MLPHDELYHYGVPGMRWGRRKLAGSFDNRAARLSELRDKKLGYANKVRKVKVVGKPLAKAYEKDAKSLEGYIHRNKKAAKVIRTAKLSERQKKGIKIAAGVVLTAAALKVGHSQFNKYTEGLKGAAFSRGYKAAWDDAVGATELGIRIVR